MKNDTNGKSYDPTWVAERILARAKSYWTGAEGGIVRTLSRKDLPKGWSVVRRSVVIFLLIIGTALFLNYTTPRIQIVFLTFAFVWAVICVFLFVPGVYASAAWAEGAAIKLHERVLELV